SATTSLGRCSKPADSDPRYTLVREEPEKHLYAKAGAPDFRESVDAEIAALELGDAGLLQLDYQANCKVD
ncbi:hypothetical protein ACI3QN_03305, partial [Propionibacterium freudenreichii]|uniref:hypothetical protein n=1 Tax=Propionibacterium freudenreichii TaxID=1744 RepID=UPI0038532A42